MSKQASKRIKYGNDDDTSIPTAFYIFWDNNDHHDCLNWDCIEIIQRWKLSIYTKPSLEYLSSFICFFLFNVEA